MRQNQKRAKKTEKSDDDDTAENSTKLEMKRENVNASIFRWNHLKLRFRWNHLLEYSASLNRRKRRLIRERFDHQLDLSNNFLAKT